MRHLPFHSYNNQFVSPVHNLLASQPADLVEDERELIDTHVESRATGSGIAVKGICAPSDRRIGAKLRSCNDTSRRIEKAVLWRAPFD